MKYLVIDPGYHTGWAVYDDARLVASGRISISNAPALPTVYLRQQILKVMSDHMPEQVWMEKLYPFIREFVKKDKEGKIVRDRRGRIKKVKNVKGSLALAQYWGVINGAISEFVEPYYLDTQQLARNKTAQGSAKYLTGRRRISPDEAEAIVWGNWLWRTGQVEKNRKEQI